MNISEAGMLKYSTMAILNSSENMFSWEAYNYSASQEIPFYETWKYSYLRSITGPLTGSVESSPKFYTIFP
jgi:hypothetical protein